MLYDQKIHQMSLLVLFELQKLRTPIEVLVDTILP
jgi:hypothetical protein